MQFPDSVLKAFASALSSEDEWVEHMAEEAGLDAILPIPGGFRKTGSPFSGVKVPAPELFGAPELKVSPQEIDTLIQESLRL